MNLKKRPKRIQRLGRRLFPSRGNMMKTTTGEKRWEIVNRSMGLEHGALGMNSHLMEGLEYQRTW